MNTPIDDLERVINNTVEGIILKLERVDKGMGDRPLLQAKKSDRELVLGYIEERTKPYSMWYRAEDIRQQLEKILSGIEDSEREANGVGKEAIRTYAYQKVLKHCEKMVTLADKLGIPVVGSANYPEQPEPEPKMDPAFAEAAAMPADPFMEQQELPAMEQQELPPMQAAEGELPW
jgi:hypothetical protein